MCGDGLTYAKILSQSTEYMLYHVLLYQLCLQDTKWGLNCLLPGEMEQDSFTVQVGPLYSLFLTVPFTLLFLVFVLFETR